MGQDSMVITAESQKENPANVEAAVTVTERTRVPMSLPVQKLAVPDIPGYHLHWILGNPARIQQALRAGYEFVDEAETDITNTGLADDAQSSGNTDLGSRVSVTAGGSGEDGQGNRLYLMKLKNEWYEADQKAYEAQSEKTAAQLRGGQDMGVNPHGSEQRYIPESARKNVSNLFTPKSRRS